MPDALKRRGLTWPKGRPEHLPQAGFYCIAIIFCKMQPMEHVDRLPDLPMPTRRDHEAAQSPPGGEPQTAKSKRRAEDSSEDCAAGMAKRSRGTSLAVDRCVCYFYSFFFVHLAGVDCSFSTPAVCPMHQRRASVLQPRPNTSHPRDHLAISLPFLVRQRGLCVVVMSRLLNRFLRAHS